MKADVFIMATCTDKAQTLNYSGGAIQKLAASCFEERNLWKTELIHVSMPVTEHTQTHTNSSVSDAWNKPETKVTGSARSNLSLIWTNPIRQATCFYFQTFRWASVSTTRADVSHKSGSQRNCVCLHHSSLWADMKKWTFFAAQHKNRFLLENRNINRWSVRKNAFQQTVKKIIIINYI